jgi:hypothetical protein
MMHTVPRGVHTARCRVSKSVLPSGHRRDNAVRLPTKQHTSEELSGEGREILDPSTE